MKPFTTTTLTVAVSMALLVTPVLAATGEVSPVPVSPADQTDTHKATEATSPAPFHALNRLDAQSLAEQEMTDQELQAVEGSFLGMIWASYVPYYDLEIGPITIIK
jgi:hypothetical protein